MRLCIVFGLICTIIVLETAGLRHDSDWSSDDYENALGVEPGGSFSRSGFRLRTPDFTPHHKLVVDSRAELQHWDEVSARLRVQLKAEPDTREMPTKNYGEILRKDVAIAEKLNKKIQNINAHIQAETLVNPSDEYPDFSSFLQLSDDGVLSDWNYCMCPSGPNGTLVFPERNWPGASLPTLAPFNLSVPQTTAEFSLLEVSLGGRRATIKRDPDCDCTNPWDQFDDPSGSSQCSRTYNATICVIHVNKAYGVKDRNDLEEDFNTLLNAIDQSFANSTPRVESVNTTDSSPNDSTPSVNITGEISITTDGSATIQSNNQDDNSTALATSVNITGEISNTTDGSATIQSNNQDDNSTAVATSVKITGEISNTTDGSEAVSTPINATGDTSDNASIESANTNSSISSESFAELWKPFRFQF